MIKMLFGKAGSGKSHVGEEASLVYGWHFHDADEDLPERFRRAIERQEQVTDDIREEYTEAIIRTARCLMAAHGNVCICQALPRNRVREKILRAIPSVEYVWIDAPDELITERLRGRSGHLASIEYAETMNRIFETPTVPHVKLVNGNDPAERHRQMSSIFDIEPIVYASSGHQTLHIAR